MDHVVYIDAKARELEQLLDGSKSMIIRGAAGRKLPHGRVNAEDILYFINNNSKGEIRAKGLVTYVLNSEKMTPEESRELVNEYQSKLRLTDKQLEKWAGKRYIVLIEVGEVQSVQPFNIDKSGYGNMDDWLPVESIENVKA